MAGRSFTAPEAAKRHLFREAAVRRHLQAIQGVFREVVAEKAGRAVRYRFAWPKDRAADAATVLALELARAGLASLRGSDLDGRLAELVQDHLRRAPEAEWLGADLSRVLVSRSRLLQMGQGTGKCGADADAVDRIAACILQRRQLTCDYTHFGGKGTRVRLEPWSLVPSEEGLFCYARCADSDAMDHVDTRRLYKVSRMARVRKSPEPFVYPPLDSYDPAQVFRHCFGVFLPHEDAQVAEVVLRFEPRWLAWLTHDRLHPTQRGPVAAGDGWLEVRIDVYLTLDLARWLRGLGREVAVVAPAALQAWVACDTPSSFRLPVG